MELIAQYQELNWRKSNICTNLFAGAAISIFLSANDSALTKVQVSNWPSTIRKFESYPSRNAPKISFPYK
jgi:hypothetical protein